MILKLEILCVVLVTETGISAVNDTRSKLLHCKVIILLSVDKEIS